MGRPVDHRKREALAEAAFDVIRARGPHRTTMKGLADALAIPRSTLYWYFPDLGSVFDTVLEVTLRRQAAFLGARLAGRGHPIELLRAYVDGLHAFYASHGDFLVLLARFWAVGDDVRQRRVIDRTRAQLRPIRRALIGLLEAEMRAGTVAPCDAAGLVDTVVAVADGALIQQLGGGADAARVRAAVDALVLTPLDLRSAREERS